MKQDIVLISVLWLSFFVFKNSADTLFMGTPAIVEAVSEISDLVLFKLFESYYLCLRVSVHHVCLVSLEARRGYRIPWNWCY